ncbi:MAG: hypothetical protein FJX03_07195 [Alphaproteobacteria bacterium]|nr:hypothetical protein [Alphaproteobacteria bacterium]
MHPLFAIEQPQSSSQTSSAALKFRITPQGEIEDAQGSDLIERFKDAVKNEVKIWENKKSKYLTLLNSYEAKLRDKATLSDSECYLIEIDLIILKRKIKICEKNKFCVTERESLLPQILKEILTTKMPFHPKMDVTTRGGVWELGRNELTHDSPDNYCSLNWKLLDTANIRHLDIIDFSDLLNSQEKFLIYKENKYFIRHNIPQLSKNLREKYFIDYEEHLPIASFQRIQKKLRQLETLLGSLSDPLVTSHSAPDNGGVNIRHITSNFGSASKERIMKEIERLEKKAHTVTIPLMAVTYWMGEVMSAFMGEIDVHRQGLSQSTTSNVFSDNS